MKKVKDILRAKQPSETYCVGPDTLVWDAIKLMSDRSVGALVVKEHEKIIGIVTERDYLKKVSVMGRSSHSTFVKEIMTPNPVIVTPDERMESCIDLMTQNRFRHLPVVENGYLIGLVSIGDLLRNIMEEQKSLIQQLEGYIRGESY